MNDHTTLAYKHNSLLLVRPNFAVLLTDCAATGDGNPNPWARHRQQATEGDDAVSGAPQTCERIKDGRPNGTHTYLFTRDDRQLPTLASVPLEISARCCCALSSYSTSTTMGRIRGKSTHITDCHNYCRNLLPLLRHDGTDIFIYLHFE